MLDSELAVAEGPHVRRKFWQMFTVSGGKVDEHGVSIGFKISKGSFRAMIDSALGLDPSDMSDAAKAKRILRGLADLNGITFVAKIKVEASADPRYGDSNRLDRVVLPNEPEWRKVMDGEVLAPSPSTRARPKAPPSEFASHPGMGTVQAASACPCRTQLESPRTIECAASHRRCITTKAGSGRSSLAQ